MITITFLKRLKFQLRIYEILHCTCYLWDKKIEKVVLISKSKIRLFYYYSITCANALYALAMSLHLAFNSSLTLVQRCAAMPFFGLQFTSLWFRWNWNFQIDPKPANVINTMMKYEMGLLQGKTTLTLQYLPVDVKTVVRAVECSSHNFNSYRIRQPIREN